jgi:hypothetical protein
MGTRERTASMTFLELATKNPRAHRCRPQHSLLRWLYSCISFRELFPLTRGTRKLADTCGGQETNRWT